jgi:DNA integrity scanning protein DisA with diadenylate cyclase activity
MAKEGFRPMEETRESRGRPLLTMDEEVGDERHPTLWILLTDDPQVISRAISENARPLLVATSDKGLREKHESEEDDILFFLTPHSIGPGINALLQVRDVLLSAFFDGAIASDDRILVLVAPSPAWEARLWYDLAQDQSIVRLKRELEYRADIAVVEAVLAIAAEIAREGREARHVGAIFIVGDSERVLANSRQVVLNPFEGHPAEQRQIIDPRNWETTKEFAQIDGAFVIDEKGHILAAGRYIDVKSRVELPSGLGGRHLACAAITKETKAIAVAVSETGVIRIFKDGDILMKIGTT